MYADTQIFGVLALMYAGALFLLFGMLIWSATSKAASDKATSDGDDSDWLSDAKVLRFAQVRNI